MWDSVIAPIHDEFKRQGFDARWVDIPKEGGDCYLFCYGSTLGPVEKTVYVFHSLGPNEGESAPPVPKIMGQLLSGPYWLEQQKTRYPAEHHRLKMVGWPKSDIVFSPKRREIEARVRKELNLSPKKKTVLWGGCHLALPLRERYVTHPQIRNVWDSLCQAKRELGFNLIVKPHVWTGFKLGGAPLDIPEEWEGEDVIWLDPRVSGNIYEQFLVADVLVSDFVESLPVEFLLMRKPSIIWSRDFGGATFGGGEPFPVIEAEPQNIGKIVEEGLDNPEMGIVEETESWSEKMFYRPDGHASERAVDAILELIGGKNDG